MFGAAFPQGAAVMERGAMDAAFADAAIDVGGEAEEEIIPAGLEGIDEPIAEYAEGDGDGVESEDGGGPEQAKQSGIRFAIAFLVETEVVEFGVV